MVKTEDQNEFQIDMFDDEFNFLMEQDFSAETNANRTNNAVNEEQETDSDATEIDEDDHPEVSGEWSVFVWFFLFTNFILQNLSKLNQWSPVARAVHQVNNS